MVCGIELVSREFVKLLLLPESKKLQTTLIETVITDASAKTEDYIYLYILPKSAQHVFKFDDSSSHKIDLSVLQQTGKVTILRCTEQPWNLFISLKC